jgi:hypothetical protein
VFLAGFTELESQAPDEERGLIPRKLKGTSSNDLEPRTVVTDTEEGLGGVEHLKTIHHVPLLVIYKGSVVRWPQSRPFPTAWAPFPPPMSTYPYLRLFTH